MPPMDSLNELAFPIAADAALSAEPSEIEREVLDLFEQFRSPLLRYAISFGLTAHDGERIIQEVFLALFRHLQSGKSRSNLRGWIFRVAHNLALKQRLFESKIERQDCSRLDDCGRAARPIAQSRRTAFLGSTTAPPAGRRRCSSGSGSRVSPAACGGPPLSGNRISTRNIPGSRIDIADSITGTVDPCGREIKLCGTKMCTFRTRNCFWRRTAN